MNFRSIDDLNRVIRENIHIFRNYDLIIGIPRSGMLPASLVALYSQKPLTSVEEFLNNVPLQKGFRLNDKSNIEKAVIIDDSINNNRQMRLTQARMEQYEGQIKLSYACIYYNPSKKYPNVDVLLEAVKYPRVFEWNIFHHPLLQHACLDLDGVICKDPKSEENDDGQRYLKFLSTAEPLFLPSIQIKKIITSRLERYRPQTEAWLNRHGVRYTELVMLCGVTAEQRRTQRMHGPFKAAEYSKDPAANLFIESNPTQASEIFKITNKPVYCVENNAFYSSRGISQSFRDHYVSNTQYRKFFKKIKHEIKNCLRSLHR